MTFDMFSLFFTSFCFGFATANLIEAWRLMNRMKKNLEESSEALRKTL